MASELDVLRAIQHLDAVDPVKGARAFEMYQRVAAKELLPRLLRQQEALSNYVAESDATLATLGYIDDDLSAYGDEVGAESRNIDAEVEQIRDRLLDDIAALAREEAA